MLRASRNPAAFAETRTSEQPRSRAHDAREAAITVYLSPFDHETNQYLKRFRDQVEKLGYRVCSAHDVWRLRSWGRGRVRRVLFLNWFEDRVLRPAKGKRLIEYLLFVYKLTVAKLQGVELIWVQHNYRTHGQTLPNWVGRCIRGILQRTSVATVVHCSRLARSQDCHYLPHPLYVPCGRPVAEPFVERLPGNLPQRVAILGQLRASKDLRATLQSWPRDVPLVIAGQPESEQYGQQIRDHVQSLKLDACLLFQQLAQHEFDYIVRHVRAIYVANPKGTMVVSGVFFHAVSLGTPVVMRRSPFSRWVAEECDFVVEVESPATLHEALEKVIGVDRAAIMSRAHQLYGQNAFVHHFEHLLATTGGDRFNG